MTTRAEFLEDWDRCAPWLAAALEYDPTHTLDEVRDLCAHHPSSFQFWPGIRSAAVSQIIEQPLIRDFHIWLAGGDLTEIQVALHSLEAFASAAKCQRVTMFARPGFKRVLGPAGYRAQFVGLAKDLTHE